MGTLLTRSLTPESLDSWGWRVPFLLGLIIGPVGLYIRRNLQEAFLEERGNLTARQGLGTTLATHLKQVLACIGVIAAGTISFYVLLLYMPTFARTQLRLPLDEAFIAQSIGIACMILVTPVSGALSDRIGRTPIIIGSLLLYLTVTYPLFRWVGDNPSFGNLAIMQIVLCSLLGVFYGPVSTAIAEQFPVRARSTGLGIGTNSGNGFMMINRKWPLQFQ